MTYAFSTNLVLNMYFDTSANGDTILILHYDTKSLIINSQELILNL